MCPRESTGVPDHSYFVFLMAAGKCGGGGCSRRPGQSALPAPLGRWLSSVADPRVYTASLPASLHQGAHLFLEGISTLEGYSTFSEMPEFLTGTGW